MRNLKRALSLALASVMLLGMMVVGAGAAYTDEAQISNVEAAEVVSALGIMSGNTDGSFNPKGTVTRGEFAVMLAQLMNGGKFNSALYKDTKLFTDVTWSAGFANYAANNGWIAGYGDGKFGQDDPVTTAQALLIVCNALKVPVSFESGYQIGALAAAEEADILDGITDLTADKGMSRENAAQLILNAALYTKSGTTYVVTIAGTPDKVLEFDNKESADLAAAFQGGVITTRTDYSSSLYATKFGTTNIADPSTGVDAYGRPATVYTIGEKTLTYAEEPDYVFTSDVKHDVVYDTVGKTIAGYRWTDLHEPKKDDDTNTYYDTAKGTRVELFVNVEGKKVTKVVIPTYVAEISGWTEADAETEAKEKIEVTYKGVVNPAPADTEFETEAFDEADATNKTVVLVTLDSESNIETVEKAEKVAGKVTKVTVGSSFVMDGKTYNYSDDYKKLDSYDIEYNKEYDLYLDKYGYVIASKKTSTETDAVYAIMEATGKTSAAQFGGGEVLQGMFTYVDGTKATLDIDVNAAYESIDLDAYDYYLVTLEYSSTDKHYDVDIADYYAGAEIVKGLPNFAAALKPANANTTFVVAKWNSDNEITGYDIYKGIKNVPTMENASVFAFADSLNEYAEIVFVYDSEEPEVVTEKPIFVLGKQSPSKVTDEKGTYYTLNAIVDGKITTIDVAASNSDDLNETVSGLYKSLTSDTKGVVTAYGDAAYEAEDLVGKTGKVIVAAKNDVIVFDETTYAYADTAVVYEIKNGAITELAGISAIKASDSANFTLVLKDDVIIAVYLGINLEA